MVFLGKKIIRLRGKCRRIPCGDQLIRDPEYERDLERIRRTTGGDGKPTQEEIKKVYHCMPPTGKPSILAQNEPPSSPAQTARSRLQNSVTPGGTSTCGHSRTLTPG